MNNTQETMQFKGIKYGVGERIRIDTGNADGSIPTVKDFQGTIEEILKGDTAKVSTSNGPLTVHADRFRKLEAGLLTSELTS